MALRESLSAADLARLEALQRLSMGAIHSLNNALTPALGEASYLLEDRKQDPSVVEACGVILASLERCARITRGLLACRNAADAELGADLGLRARELGPLLTETLGSRHALDVRTPAESLPVRLGSASLELLVITLVHYAADQAAGGARLRLCVENSEGAAALRLEVSAASVADAVIDCVNDPGLATDTTTRSCLEAVREISQRAGGELRAARISPDSWALIARLPLAE